MGAPLLQVVDLVKHFGGVRAVDRVTLVAEQGCITGLIGPNGAGKSTLLGLVSGAIPPTAGRVLFAGRDVTGWPPHRLARQGLVRTFQTARIFGGLTAIENLMVAAPGQRAESLAGALGGRWLWHRQERKILAEARRLLQRFGLEEIQDQLARTLSGGQRRALEIMRALMTHPRLLLLDEPMAGLSPALRRQLEDAFLELRREGLSLLLVEHELDTVDRICDTVVVMAQGQVIGQGRMDDLRQRREVQDAYVIG